MDKKDKIIITSGYHDRTTFPSNNRISYLDEHNEKQRKIYLVN